MIYRKWSLLTGPTGILAGLVGTLVVANYILIDKLHIFQDPFQEPEQKKADASLSTK